MDIKKMLKIFISLSFLLFFLFYMYTIEGSNDLIASLAQLPGLADSPDKGTFVDLVKVLDKEYTEGRIKIEVYPFQRSIDNIISGKADFHIPSLRNPEISTENVSYQYVKEKLGDVNVVIYSHIDKPITKKMIYTAESKGGKFPYKIESAGLITNFSFPCIPTANLDQSLQKVAAKRVDALIWAQEEGDMIIRNRKMKAIHREFLQSFDDVIVIPKGPEGDRLNKILSNVIIKMRKSGELQELFLKVHKPYNNWQPSKMGW